ncbi:MAG TPA: hypothetical protein VGR28_03465 [Candidatus Thermoplasmatota archaeon]|nr:hypothetical protein [Candidatus Thermoplasmatota archaeon]
MPRLRTKFLALILVALAAAGLLAASAFNAASTGTRTVSASVVGDSSAYLALAVRSASPHAGFVTTSGGKVVVSFGSGVATGTGINPEGTYYFDDLLTITNQGTASVNVVVASSATAGTVKACVKTATGAMDNTCYSTSTTSTALAVGSVLYVGIMTQANSVASGSTVSGTIEVTGSR